MNSNETGIEGLVNTMSGSIPQTITTYKEQMLTTDMMRRVQRTLGLEKEFSAAMLKEMISVSNIKDTNLLSVVVTAKDSKLATDIANTLAAEFSDFVADMNSQRLSKSSSFLQEKVQEEKVNLANALEEYKIFLAQSPGTSEIQSEIGSKSSRLNILKEELDKLSTEFARETLGVENDIKLKNTEIDNIDELIRITDKFIIQRQSVIKDSTVSGIVQAFGQDSSELLDMKLESEVVNPNYINLHSQYNSVLVEMEVLQQEKSNIESTYVITRGLIESEIHLITKSLEELKVTYAEKNNQEKLITKMFKELNHHMISLYKVMKRQELLSLLILASQQYLLTQMLLLIISL